MLPSNYSDVVQVLAKQIVETCTSLITRNNATSVVDLLKASKFSSSQLEDDISTSKIREFDLAVARLARTIIDSAVIGTAQIADASITDAKVVTLSASKLTAGVIDATEIIVNNLTADNITVGTLNGERIPVLGSEHIEDGAITQTAIRDEAVGSQKLAVDSVTSRSIAAEAVQARNILAHTITSDQIAARSIDATCIKTNSITVNELKSGIECDLNIRANTSINHLFENEDKRVAWQRFSENGMELGKDGSAFSVVLDEEALTFYEGGNRVAWVSNDTMHETNAEVETELKIGAFSFIKTGDGGVGIIWKG